MADPFVAEIRIFPFAFAPKGWAQCDGQLVPLGQNTALFALLGTTYGGNGQSNFALPDLRGSAPMHPDQNLHFLGERGGTETVVLGASEIPAHTHALNASSLVATDNDPDVSGVLAAPPPGATAYHDGPVTGALSPAALAPAGSNTAHDNMQPYLTLSFCIALQGVFPPRP